MENVYQNIKQRMKKQLKLSPYNPNQRLRLVIDGARTAGTGFLLIQYADDKDVAKGVNIIHSGSNLLPLDRDFSCMKAEAIALDRAISACHHWLYSVLPLRSAFAGEKIRILTFCFKMVRKKSSFGM